jgi:chromosomal replication initiator protein
MIMTEYFIIKEVCDYYHITKEDMNCKSRLSELVKARQLVMFFCRKYTSLTSGAIGKLINRDHSTVLSGRKSVQDQLDTDKDYRMQFNELNEKIKDSILREKNEADLINQEIFQENDFYNKL